MRPSRRIAVGAFGVAALLVLVAGPSLWAFREIEEAANLRDHTNAVLQRAADLMASLVDAETGQRGYLLTGDEAFLESYLSVRDTVAGDLEKLRQHTDLLAAQERLSALSPMIVEKMAYLAKNIELRRKEDLTGALANVRGLRGKNLMDSIRAEMLAFNRIEQDHLAELDSDYRSKMRLIFGIVVAACLFSLLFALALVVMIQREAQQRLQAAVHVDTQRSLTAQEGVNQQLQAVNAALQVSEEKLSVTLSSIGDAVIATDDKACVTLLNPQAQKLTGWTPAEALGRPVSEVFHILNEETRQLALDPVKEALASGAVQGLANHTVLIARGGSEAAIADSCAPIRDRDGLVVGAVLVFRDVTQEYATQQKLRDGTALVRTVFDTVADGIMTVRVRGAVVESVNRATEKMFGQPAAELVGQSVTALIPGFLLEEAEMSLGSAREVSGRRKDGSAFPAELTLSEMWLGEERHVTGILRDISARKDVEAALLKAGALQNAIFNSANFSSIATDAKGVIQIFNVGAERMLGYPAAEVMNKVTPAEISDPEELIMRAKSLSVELSTPIAPGFEALVFKASRGIEDIYDLTYIRKDGSRLPAAVSVTALRDAQDAIIGYLLIGTDNTARKEVEADRTRLDQRLHDQQFYTRSLIEASVDALLTTDPNGIITDLNRQAEMLTGCTRDELIGSPFKNHFTEPERAEAGISRTVAEKQITNYELTARARDGTETPVSYNATTFYDRQRKLQGVFAAARDISERKTLDRTLMERNVALENATALAERASLAKSDFLSAMSHELRSPLNAMLGFAQLMESDDPPPTPEQRDSLTQILKAGWHLLTLINDILDLTKIEARQVPLSEEPVSLEEVIQECEEMTEPQAQQRSLKRTFPRFDVPCFVLADRTRLKQVLINLLSNAIKYNVPNGLLEVTCTESAPGRVRVSIRDTGVGLTPQQVPQLFQAFNRLGQEAGIEEGTGIGLVVAKRLVELMGGTIGVESTVGVGSVFWFELLTSAEPRIAHEHDTVPADAVQPAPGARPRTVLYVEDNPANLKLVAQIIARRPDLHLVTAVDATLGIEIARTQQPEVILMDINLPGISGLEALKILNADRSTAHIPVVAVSANAMPLDVAKGMKAGFFRYVVKPIMIREFMEALDLALDFAHKREVPLPGGPTHKGATDEQVT